MRNPHSSEGYNGAYSDKSSAWTAAMKSEINLVVANDGTFWMPFSDWHTYFRDLVVTFYEDYGAYSKVDLPLKTHELQIWEI